MASSTLLCLVAAREAIAVSRNRTALMQAEWEAEGCLSRARAIVEHAVRQEEEEYVAYRAPAWQRVDHLVEASAVGPCRLTVQPTGARVDINTVDDIQLGKGLRLLGLPAAAADSMAAAILDWIDDDDVARPLGAEAAWYRARTLPVPPDRPLVDIRELHGVRGFTDALDLGRIFGVEQDVIAISHATAEILELIPGLGGEIGRHIIELRDRGVLLRSFADLAMGLPTSMQLDLHAAVPELARVASLHPAGWILAAQYATSDAAPSVRVEVRIQRHEGRVIVVRRRARPV